MSRRPRGFVGLENELRDAFRCFDHSSNGSVNMAELRRALTSLGELLTDEQIDKMFTNVPTDGDGFVKYEGSHKFFYVKVMRPHPLPILFEYYTNLIIYQFTLQSRS